MKKAGWLAALIFIPLLAFANCDLSSFRWACDIHAHVKPTHHAHSLVYCGNTPFYISKRDYLILVHYQRANVNMTLTANDEYIDSPCIPAGF